MDSQNRSLVIAAIVVVAAIVVATVVFSGREKPVELADKAVAGAKSGREKSGEGEPGVTRVKKAGGSRETAPRRTPAVTEPRRTPEAGNPDKMIEALVERGDASAIRDLLQMLGSQADPGVRERVLSAIALCDGRGEAVADMTATLVPAYQASTSLRERIAIQNAFADIEDQRAASFLETSFRDAKASPEERANAAVVILDLRALSPSLVNAAVTGEINEKLKLDLQASEDPELRATLVTALARDPEQNRQFLTEWRAKEKDEAVLRNLASALGGPAPEDTATTR